MVARQLSDRESAALKSISEHSTGDAQTGPGATMIEISRDLSGAGIPTTVQGARMSADTLVSKRLAWRANTAGDSPMWRVTVAGEQALKGDRAGAWIVRTEPGHNHVTRDIKPAGVCPACDRYHASQAS